MLLQADEMIYDNENNRVTAKGNVEIYYGNYTLLADQVIYDRNANTLAAQGNVRIKDPDGAIITSNQMTLTDDFRDGFIDALRVVTKDDTRIVAQTASREAGNVTVFQNGWFTPCKPCEDNPDKPPTWRIRAQDHHSPQGRGDDHLSATPSSTFSACRSSGCPISKAPIPTVKRKSGFLMPMYSQSDRLGTTVTVPYYFALSDHYDFTFAPMYHLEGRAFCWQGLAAASGERRLSRRARRRVQRRHLRIPEGRQQRLPRQRRHRRASSRSTPIGRGDGTSIAESDDTFRRFYNLDSELKTDRISQLYLEGLHDRNYFGMRFYNTQSLLFTRRSPCRCDGLSDHRLRLHRQEPDHRRRAQLQLECDGLVQRRRHRFEPPDRRGQLAAADDRRHRSGLHAVRANFAATSTA